MNQIQRIVALGVLGMIAVSARADDATEKRVLWCNIAVNGESIQQPVAAVFPTSSNCVFFEALEPNDSQTPHRLGACLDVEEGRGRVTLLDSDHTFSENGGSYAAQIGQLRMRLSDDTEFVLEAGLPSSLKDTRGVSVAAVCNVR